jgi:hypothetical protein
MKMLERKSDEEGGGSYSGGGNYASSRKGPVPAPELEDDDEVPF